MRNLSYHVHKEVPGADKYQELDASQTTSTGGSQKKKKDDAGCFGGKKAKGTCCRELRTGNGFGGEFCCVGLLSQAHSSCGFSAVQLAEVRVCGVVARVRLPCSVTTRYLGIFFHGCSSFVWLWTGVVHADRWLCAVGQTWMCLPLLCFAVFLHPSHLRWARAARVPGPHGFPPACPARAAAVPPVARIWKQAENLPSHSQPKHTTSQFCHSFSNLNCKHEFVAFNCQSLLDLFSPLGYECCKWVSLQERINSLSNPPSIFPLEGGSNYIRFLCCFREMTILDWIQR